jgi:hypothetical protein
MSVYRNGIMVQAGVDLKYYGITLKKQLTVWQRFFNPSPFFGLSPAVWFFSFVHDLSDLYRICTRFRFCDQGQSTGQVTKDLEGNLVVKGDFETQARQVFANLKNILEEAEGRIQNIVKMNAFLAHFDYIETYRKVRDEFIQELFSPNPAVFKHCDGKQKKSAGSKCILRSAAFGLRTIMTWYRIGWFWNTWRIKYLKWSLYSEPQRVYDIYNALIFVVLSRYLSTPQP